jgi:hypothetical protein
MHVAFGPILRPFRRQGAFLTQVIKVLCVLRNIRRSTFCMRDDKKRKSMYTVQKSTPILEVVLETRTMKVRLMKTAARTTVKRVVMMARLTL